MVMLAPISPTAPYRPSGIPEFFGDTIVVNGRTWPYLEVEPRLYRFRFLNGTNARFLILKANVPLDFHVIGTEGGLLPDQPVVLDQLLIGPAERFDVIVDFSSFQPGDEIILLNLGPDEPFGGLPVEVNQPTPTLPDRSCSSAWSKQRITAILAKFPPRCLPLTG